jgi:hypothetical protein
MTWWAQPSRSLPAPRCRPCRNWVDRAVSGVQAVRVDSAEPEVRAVPETLVDQGCQAGRMDLVLEGRADLVVDRDGLPAVQALQAHPVPPVVVGDWLAAEGWLDLPDPESAGSSRWARQWVVPPEWAALVLTWVALALVARRGWVASPALARWSLRN